eukprot:TRINITY_DN10701_c0_g1_i1.p1 TRINITY_DN10701_c0_g1~~TRINITY_DN10701_c0_g1_i1.p1  ORF type:complete len:719 (-),score=62.05 TRINITY_DN10701_c0_g1_i1:65-2173(-)
MVGTTMPRGVASSARRPQPLLSPPPTTSRQLRSRSANSASAEPQKNSKLPLPAKPSSGRNTPSAVPLPVQYSEMRAPTRRVPFATVVPAPVPTRNGAIRTRSNSPIVSLEGKRPRRTLTTPSPVASQAPTPSPPTPSVPVTAQVVVQGEENAHQGQFQPHPHPLPLHPLVATVGQGNHSGQRGTSRGVSNPLVALSAPHNKPSFQVSFSAGGLTQFSLCVAAAPTVATAPLPASSFAVEAAPRSTTPAATAAPAQDAPSLMDLCDAALALHSFVRTLDTQERHEWPVLSKDTVASYTELLLQRLRKVLGDHTTPELQATDSAPTPHQPTLVDGTSSSLNLSESALPDTDASACEPLRETPGNSANPICVSPSSEADLVEDEDEPPGPVRCPGCRRQSTTGEFCTSICIVKERLLQERTVVPMQKTTNVRFVVEYASDIHCHYFLTEGRHLPCVGYLAQQPDINDRMRMVLVDWLVDVHAKLRFKPNVLYLTVNILDRYLARVEVTRGDLQLVGAAAMLLAAKYEETIAPVAKDFVTLCANSFSRAEILLKEKEILEALQFVLTVPTVCDFLQRALQVGQSDPVTCLVSQYFAELWLTDYTLLSYLPSAVAAASVLLGRRVSGCTQLWGENMLAATMYHEAHLVALADQLCALARAQHSRIQAVRRKYTRTKHGSITAVVDEHLSKEPALIQRVRPDRVTYSV